LGRLRYRLPLDLLQEDEHSNFRKRIEWLSEWLRYHDAAGSAEGEHSSSDSARGGVDAVVAVASDSTVQALQAVDQKVFEYMKDVTKGFTARLRLLSCSSRHRRSPQSYF